ncbi:restriction endonuclease subunit S [Priestia megaterium]|uniref:restriction endonuclease subunit S n=1 Tax=Priestia megaterium TaxID=1404 RepID=UPI001B3A36A1|nr:restriction endonuclease subunit S [Priestia megaterium]MBQ4867483.1 restriction endonuclease subunit S [Priestia megaterium]
MSRKKKTMEGLLEQALIPEQEYPYELSENWIWTQVGYISTLTDYVANGSFKSLKDNVRVYEHEEFSYFIRLYDLRRGIGHPTQKYVDKPSYEFLSKSSLVGGEILLASVGSVGVVYMMPTPDRHSTVAPNLIICKPNEKLYNSYLYYFFKSPIGQEFIDKISTGTTQPKINKTNLKTMLLPLPPLNEQKRIVGKLEGLLNNIEEAKQLIEEAKETFEFRRSAILDKAFRGELTKKWRDENHQKNSVLVNKINEISLDDKNMGGDSSIPETSIPNSWKWVLSNDLFSFVTSGSRGWAKYYDDEGDFFIRVGNLNHQSIDIDLTNQQKVSPPKGTEGSRTLVQEGDILISITADIGRIAVVPKEFPTAYINQHVALARPINSYCSEYIAWFLSSRNGGRFQFDRLQRGATKAGLGLSDIKNVWVPIPSLEEQYEIINKIETIFKKFEVAEENLINTLKTCEELKVSILAKAFRGELGTNDPSDENAIELLKEVLQEQVK